ncbi:hypothetical protein GGX14DRAFT_557697 [Mycena pura]|uniref:Uncharacterized protein n=1 Tax=Mycena pura TaxID=153505 RepID=A0AAD6YLH5_9AGAR|nr:hypothetical protein GGX14DRAFT_557697 [Mycena pura]
MWMLHRPVRPGSSSVCLFPVHHDLRVNYVSPRPEPKADAFSLVFADQLRVTGDILRGHVELNIPVALEDGIKEISVHLFGTIDIRTVDPSPVDRPQVEGVFLQSHLLPPACIPSTDVIALTMLLDWTATRICALYAAHDAAQLDADLDATFAPDAEFHMNHVCVDRATFAASLPGRAAGTTTKVDVECSPEDLIEAPVAADNPEASGFVAGSIVAGKVTVVRTHPWRIRAAHAKSRIVIVFSVKIEKNPQPQIVQLFQTSASKPFPIVFPTVRQPQEVDADTL